MCGILKSWLHVVRESKSNYWRQGKEDRKRAGGEIDQQTQVTNRQEEDSRMTIINGNVLYIPKFL
jgi:hypothetical protein